jgi:hypothetical protein
VLRWTRSCGALVRRRLPFRLLAPAPGACCDSAAGLVHEPEAWLVHRGVGVGLRVRVIGSGEHCQGQLQLRLFKFVTVNDASDELEPPSCAGETANVALLALTSSDGIGCFAACQWAGGPVDAAIILSISCPCCRHGHLFSVHQVYEIYEEGRLCWPPRSRSERRSGDARFLDHEAGVAPTGSQ